MHYCTLLFNTGYEQVLQYTTSQLHLSVQTSGITDIQEKFHQAQKKYRRGAQKKKKSRSPLKKRLHPMNQNDELNESGDTC